MVDAIPRVHALVTFHKKWNSFKCIRCTIHNVVPLVTGDDVRQIELRRLVKETDISIDDLDNFDDIARRLEREGFHVEEDALKVEDAPKGESSMQVSKRDRHFVVAEVDLAQKKLVRLHAVYLSLDKALAHSRRLTEHFLNKNPLSFKEMQSEHFDANDPIHTCYVLRKRHFFPLYTIQPEPIVGRRNSPTYLSHSSQSRNRFGRGVGEGQGGQNWGDGRGGRSGWGEREGRGQRKSGEKRKWVDYSDPDAEQQRKEDERKAELRRYMQRKLNVD